jgi:RND superfamily putative drug exporter
MHVLGPRNWWLPSWMDRMLPTVHIEADDLAEPVEQLEPVGDYSNA